MVFLKGYKPWNAGTSKTKVRIVCENCGKVVTKYSYCRNKVRFCSNKCAHEFMPNPMKGRVGKDSPNWKENKKRAFRKSLRYLNIYKVWRDNVFVRDDFTCRNCGYRGGSIEAHHITPFAKILDKHNVLTYDDAYDCKELWNVDNGITYCLRCHTKKDSKRYS